MRPDGPTAPHPRDVQMALLETASTLIRDGSVKSVTRRLASEMADREEAKALVDEANAFLKKCYDPRWKHLPVEQRDMIAEVLDRTLDVMEEGDLDLVEAMKQATESIEQEQDELEDGFDDEDYDDGLEDYDSDEDVIYSPHCGPVVRDGRTYEVAIWTFTPDHPDDPPLAWSAEIRRPDQATVGWTAAFASEGDAHAAVLAELELRALPPD